MSVAVNEASRPPYVVFEQRQREDRNATLANGRYSAVSYDVVIVRQAGSKDSSEFDAADWLERISRNPGYKPEWVDGFKEMYRKWKAGQDPGLNGTPILGCGIFSPSQQAMLTAITVHTVEDLAAANESTLARIGIGARDLKMKAQAWLNTAQNTGKVAVEVNSLRGMVEELQRQNQELRALIINQAATPPPVQPKELDPL